MGLSISNIFSINLNYINYETVCMLLILPIMFLILCSDDTVEEIGGSNHVLFERYLQEVINISMDNLERVRLVVQELVLSTTCYRYSIGNRFRWVERRLSRSCYFLLKHEKKHSDNDLLSINIHYNPTAC